MQCRLLVLEMVYAIEGKLEKNLVHREREERERDIEVFLPLQSFSVETVSKEFLFSTLTISFVCIDPIASS